MPNIVAFIGPIGCGKSTAANSLNRFKRVSFADPLKNMLMAMGLTADEVYGIHKQTPPKILCGKTPREAMQYLGTEWGRKLIGEEIWLRTWQRAIEPLFNVVVDDARFPNEIALIRSMGGKIFKIVREGAGLQTTHESEGYDLHYDEIIGNNKSIDKFIRDVHFTIARQSFR